MEQRSDLGQLRGQIEGINESLLELLNQRALLVQQIAELKRGLGLPIYDPLREKQQIETLQAANRGPMSPAMVAHVFRELFRASVTYLEQGPSHELLVTRRTGRTKVVQVGNTPVGAGKPVLIAGPCSVESWEFLEPVARRASELGLSLLRGGAFKPRSSPYDFQGLGMQGVELLQRAAEQYGMSAVTEVTDAALAGEIAQKVAMVQVGARNMFNYELLRTLGRLGKPVLLKRGFGARVDELLLAAEYLLREGNQLVILCERGIRTFENATRSTLDISAVCLLKAQTDLPVVVDVSHAAGRRDILTPLAKAALAAGADGVMVEVHPHPTAALSDGGQQLDLEELRELVSALSAMATII